MADDNSVAPEAPSDGPQQAPTSEQSPDAALAASATQLLQSDIDIVTKDYQLLKDLNDAAAKKYAEMATVTKSLSVHVEDVKSKYRSFEPYLAKVDEVSAVLHGARPVLTTGGPDLRFRLQARANGAHAR